MQRKQAVLNPQTDKERFEEFVGTISAVAKEVQRIKANESAKLGLQGADIMVLYYLGQSDTGLTGADLARASGCTRAAVSRTLARMEREGFVKVGEGSGESAHRVRHEERLGCADRYRAQPNVRFIGAGAAMSQRAF